MLLKHVFSVEKTKCVSLVCRILETITHFYSVQVRKNDHLRNKPLELSSDNTELTVQFFWQVPNKYDQESRIDLLTEPTSSKGLNRGPGKWLAYEETDDLLHKIRSGEVFTFRTTDPAKYPLPRKELLEMQWYLQRLVSMSGAAGWPSLDWDDDDDDMIPCLNPSYANDNMNTTSQDVYKWIPLPPPNSEPEVVKEFRRTPIECV